MLKNNNMYLGDCLEIMKEIPDSSVDMILQDPPYNKIKCKWERDIIPYIHEFWGQWERIIKPNGVVVMTACQPFMSSLVMSNPKMFKYEWIWEKSRPTNQMLCKKQPLRAHENIAVFYKKQPIYNPQMWEGNNNHGSKKGISKQRYLNRVSEYPVNTSNIKYPRSVIQIKSLNAKKCIHPTEKPILLFEYLIKTYTNEGDMVFDGFSGSGTTAVACIKTKRNYICVEKDVVHWCNSIERINQYSKSFIEFQK